MAKLRPIFKTFAALAWLSLLANTHAEAQRGGPANVFIEPVAERAFSREIEALGTLQPREQVDLTLNAADRVTALYFDDGERVRQGKTLLSLAQREQVALVEAAEANVDEARRQLERVERLAEADAVSRSELDRARRDIDSAEANLRALQSRQRDRVLVAPFDGVLGFRQVSVGSFVRPGDVVATLIDDSEMLLDFDVPSILLRSIQPGTVIEAVTDDLPGEVFNGTVEHLSGQVVGYSFDHCAGLYRAQEYGWHIEVEQHLAVIDQGRDHIARAHKGAHTHLPEAQHAIERGHQHAIPLARLEGAQVGLGAIDVASGTVQLGARHRVRFGKALDPLQLAAGLIHIGLGRLHKGNLLSLGKGQKRLALAHTLTIIKVKRRDPVGRIESQVHLLARLQCAEGFDLAGECPLCNRLDEDIGRTAALGLGMGVGQKRQPCQRRKSLEDRTQLSHSAGLLSYHQPRKSRPARYHLKLCTQEWPVWLSPAG